MRGSGQRVTALCLALWLALGRSGPAAAHGFGQRYDLPVPLWLYVTGAAAAVAFSFLVVGVFVRGTYRLHAYPRLNLLQYPIGRLLAYPVCLFCLRLLSVYLFVLVILTGLLSNPHPMRNLAPTLVRVIWWVGLAYVSALGGNLWAVLNPWAVLFTWAEALTRRVAPAVQLTYHLPYPRQLGHWPAVLLFLGFAWSELVFEGAAVPTNLAILALEYTVITWTGMVMFGKATWLRYGEAFTVTFGLLARFAPTEVRVLAPEACRGCRFACRDQDGACIDCYACFQRADRAQREWNLRPFATGLIRPQPASTSEMVFVLLLLATVTFDGVMSTPFWTALERTLSTLSPALGEARRLWFRTLGPAIHTQLAALVNDFARQGYRPDAVQPFATVDEARQRWAALRTFAQTHGHLLITNGPYRLAQWSTHAVALEVFRDLSYPLGVGSYDRYAIPRRASISQMTPHAQGFEIHAEVERVEKFQRTYDLSREPLRRLTPADQRAELPLCRYVGVHADGTVVHAGTAPYTGDGVFFVELQGKLRPGLYTITLALYLHENYIQPEIKTIPYRVEEP